MPVSNDCGPVRADSEIGACHVYRIDPASHEVAAVATDFMKPNGPAHIRKFMVNSDGKSLSGGAVFAECTNGLFDGVRPDREGRIWSSAADGIHGLNSQDVLIGKLHISEMVGNVCFGRAKLNGLFAAGTSSHYAVHLNVNGAAF